ncbi:MAG: baseplate J/gp47 family protein [Eubacteriales bacterium]
MLPIPTLDDQGFSQIMEQAKGQIAQYSSTWTDYNHHDPGITLLELFAFFKEAQQYHLDQIGPRNRQKFLKLLGATPETPKGAKVWCNLHGTNQILPRGTELKAGNVLFSLASTTELSQVEVLGGTVEPEGQSFQMPQPGQKLHLLPLGMEATPGNAFTLRLSQPPKEMFNLYFRLESEKDTPRNSLPEGHPFTPLVTLSWSHATHDGWAPLTVVADGTDGLLFDGQITLQSTASWGENPVIRCTLKRGSYDVPPVVVGISTQMAVAVQERVTAWMESVVVVEKEGKYGLGSDHALSQTGKVEAYFLEDGLYYPVEQVEQAGTYLLCSYKTDFQLARILATATGFPNQNYDLPAKGLVAESFAILVQAAESSGFALWQQVADFDTSTPQDTHYILDCQQGTITFGNCHHGMAPEGEIRLVSLSQTLGQGGNIKAGALENLGDITLCNPDNAYGGTDQESQQDCLERCRHSLQEIHRGVTYEDYEALVYGTPGLRIANAMAVPVTKLARPDGTLPAHRVTLVVEPYGQKKALSPEYRANILAYLEPRRMLGTQVEIVSPTYVNISIFSEILIKPHYLDGKARIATAVEDYFKQARHIGATVQYSQLYGILDTLDCVSAIETLTIDAQGRGISRSLSGDVILPYNGLPVLQSASYQIRTAQ